jgi:predicted TIM-barrel fold metal-dependent hydrolase
MTPRVASEPIIEPDLPIIDTHHHLWFHSEAMVARNEGSEAIAIRYMAIMQRRTGNLRYLFDELMADLQSGHNVRASVYVNAYSMYRTTGPDELKSVGEVEFVNGVAAMGASGLFGDVRPCAGIVGGADLALGEAVEDVLVAHIQAGGGRYRGVRTVNHYDDDPALLGGHGTPHLLLDAKYRSGVSRLKPLGLLLEVMVLEPQLPELLDLVRAFPETQIVIDHVGAPVGIGRYAGQREERFPIWRENMRLLSQCDNTVIKLGGLGIPFGGFACCLADPPCPSEQLAQEWKPYIETCIELFGVDRSLFESNFPADACSTSYPVLWNAFKRITSGASDEEKAALYSGTATRVYRLELAPRIEPVLAAN